MASRNDVEQAAVSTSILARLRTALDLNERQVYETVSADYLPKIPKGGEFFVALSWLDGDFIDGEQTPGNLTEETGIAVTAYTRIRLDSTDHDEALLRDATRGLFILKKQILAALSGFDLHTDSGDSFLRQLLYARRCNAPASGEITDGKVSIGLITLEFGVAFDWSLT